MFLFFGREIVGEPWEDEEDAEDAEDEVLRNLLDSGGLLRISKFWITRNTWCDTGFVLFQWTPSYQ